MKTTLKITVNRNSVVSLSAIEHTPSVDGVKAVNNVISKFPYFMQKTNGESYENGMLSAYIRHVSPVFVYTSLKTVYAKTGHPTIYNLMREITSLTSGKAISRESIDSFDSVFGIDSDGNTLPTMSWKEHKYKMVRNGDRMYRIETIPYETFELTKTGKKLISVSASDLSHDIEDLLSVAYLAIIELDSYGLINMPSDVWNYRNYVYRALNKAITANKTLSKKSLNIDDFMANGEENVIFNTSASSAYDKMVKNAEFESICNSLEHILRNTLDSRTNKDNVIFCFEYAILQGHTFDETAEVLKTSHKQIERYVNLIKKALNKETIRFDIA